MQSAVITVYGDRDIDNLREEIDIRLEKITKIGKIRHMQVAASGTATDPWAMVVILYDLK